MAIEIREGNVLNTECILIAHQVNCKAVMGSGVAFDIKKRYPEVFKAYKDMCNAYHRDPNLLLGRVGIARCKDGRIIANIFGQNDYGRVNNDNRLFTNYDALDKGFSFLYNYCLSLKIKKIAMPYMIGCGRGGGDWSLVKMLLKRYYENSKVDLELWRL